MSNELTLREAALAWAQGKRVQATAAGGSGEFYDIGKPGETSGHWNPLVFNGTRANHKFRLAPEPPAKKWRPWTPEEVPVGARFRFTNHGSHQWLITGWNLSVIFTSNPSQDSITPELAFSCGCQHSIDNGKTWLPCGVEVEA